MADDSRIVIPRSFPEGTVPLIAIEGTASECGRHYVEIVRDRYPGYRDYLDRLDDWESLPPPTRKLFEKHAPYILDLIDSMRFADRGAEKGDNHTKKSGEGCTSFSVRADLTLDGGPISGQTKDTVSKSAELYIVLRMRIRGGPTMLVLAYPGELVGYGMWSTGMTIFRNALYSSGEGESGLTMVQWAILALAGKSVDQAVELARHYGIQGTGNCLISDSAGQSNNIEFNVGGVSIIPAENGIAVHANHPVGEKTAPFLEIPHSGIRENSLYRQRRLAELLSDERGRLTAQKALACLSDHSAYPGGICRHAFEDRQGWCTTAAVIAEPAKGILHVTRGQPCCNRPVTYSL